MFGPPRYPQNKVLTCSCDAPCRERSLAITGESWPWTRRVNDIRLYLTKLPFLAARIPPVAAPLMIEFHGSSFFRKWTNVQSMVLNIPPQTAKFPAIIGDRVFIAAKLPSWKQTEHQAHRPPYIKLPLPFVCLFLTGHSGSPWLLGTLHHQYNPWQRRHRSRPRYGMDMVLLRTLPWCLLKSKVNVNLPIRISRCKASWRVWRRPVELYNHYERSCNLGVFARTAVKPDWTHFEYQRRMESAKYVISRF